MKKRKTVQLTDAMIADLQALMNAQQLAHAKLLRRAGECAESLGLDPSACTLDPDRWIFVRTEEQ